MTSSNLTREHSIITEGIFSNFRRNFFSGLFRSDTAPAHSFAERKQRVKTFFNIGSPFAGALGGIRRGIQHWSPSAAKFVQKVSDKLDDIRNSPGRVLTPESRCDNVFKTFLNDYSIYKNENDTPFNRMEALKRSTRSFNRVILSDKLGAMYCTKNVPKYSQVLPSGIPDNLDSAFNKIKNIKSRFPLPSDYDSSLQSYPYKGHS